MGQGACTARTGSIPRAAKVLWSRSIPYRTPCGETQKTLSRVSAAMPAAVVATKFAAPGSMRVCWASTESTSLVPRTRSTMRRSNSGGVGSPAPLNTVTVACGSVDNFRQLTQLTGFAAVSTNVSLPVG